MTKAHAIARLCKSTLPFATVVAPAGYGKTTLLWSTGTLRVRRTRSGLVGALTLPLYYDGRMQSVEGWLGWFAVDAVSGALDAIKNDLGQIADAHGDLNDERKQDVQSANQKFSAQLEAVASDLGSNLSQCGEGAGGECRQGAGELVPADLRFDRLRLTWVGRV